MTDAPRRWLDDSPEEDAAASHAHEHDGLQRWMAEQKARPLTDTLAEHGIEPGEGQGWAGPLILPDWWEEIPEPAEPCPWCQRPGVPAPCQECRQARATGVDQPAEWAFWLGCSPAQRRLHIAGCYGTDPWSGRYCNVRQEWSDLDPEGNIRTRYLSWSGAAPRGTYWETRRRG